MYPACKALAVSPPNPCGDSWGPVPYSRGFGITCGRCCTCTIALWKVITKLIIIRKLTWYLVGTGTNHSEELFCLSLQRKGDYMYPAIVYLDRSLTLQYLGTGTHQDQTSRPFGHSPSEGLDFVASLGWHYSNLTDLK